MRGDLYPRNHLIHIRCRKKKKKKCAAPADYKILIMRRGRDFPVQPGEEWLIVPYVIECHPAAGEYARWMLGRDVHKHEYAPCASTSVCRRVLARIGFLDRSSASTDGADTAFLPILMSVKSTLRFCHWIYSSAAYRFENFCTRCTHWETH